MLIPGSCWIPWILLTEYNVGKGAKPLGARPSWEWGRGELLTQHFCHMAELSVGHGNDNGQDGGNYGRARKGPSEANSSPSPSNDQVGVLCV